MRPASFSLMAIPLSAAAKEEEATVKTVDKQLVAQREVLKAFKVNSRDGRILIKKHVRIPTVPVGGVCRTCQTVDVQNKI